MNACLRLKPNSQGMVFDPSTGASYLFSPTGLRIINAWLHGKDDNAAAQSLAAKYDVSVHLALRDIQDFRFQLQTNGLN